MQLTPKHLSIAKHLAQQIWLNSDHHEDYLKEKLSKLNRVNTNIVDNIWYLLGQFDMQNLLELHRQCRTSLRGRDVKIGKELAKFIEEEYFEKLINEGYE